MPQDEKPAAASPNQTQEPTDPAQLERHAKQTPKDCPKGCPCSIAVRSFVAISLPKVNGSVTTHKCTYNSQKRRPKEATDAADEPTNHCPANPTDPRHQHAPFACPKPLDQNPSEQIVGEFN
jgi:hypothetical protein